MVDTPLRIVLVLPFEMPLQHLRSGFLAGVQTVLATDEAVDAPSAIKVRPHLAAADKHDPSHLPGPSSLQLVEHLRPGARSAGLRRCHRSGPAHLRPMRHAPAHIARFPLAILRRLPAPAPPAHRRLPIRHRASSGSGGVTVPSRSTRRYTPSQPVHTHAHRYPGA